MFTEQYKLLVNFDSVFNLTIIVSAHSKQSDCVKIPTGLLVLRALLRAQRNKSSIVSITIAEYIDLSLTTKLCALSKVFQSGISQ